MTDTGFTADEEELLRTLLDVVLPASADGRLPAGGTLGLVDHVAATVRKTPMLRPVLEYGLGALAELATKRNPGGWRALSPRERVETFAAFMENDQFFRPAFLFLAYSGYYQHPRVVTALGLEPRAPHPGGHAMAPDDWTVLEPVRTRGAMYRRP